MLSNSFCFVLQVLAVLQEIRLSQRGCLPGIKQAELLRRYGPEPSPLADYGISSIKSPHTTRWPLRPSSVTSHHVSILEATKGREPASHPSGPGSSTTGGMLSNPFCFVLQIFTLVRYVLCTPMGETDCQRRRRNEQSATGNLTEFGQIKDPSRSLRLCNCVVAYHEWEHTPASKRGSEPHCNTTSGKYNPVQCNTTDPWCVEPDSGRLLGVKMHGGCSSNLSTILCSIDGIHHGHHGSHGQLPQGSHSDLHHGSHSISQHGTHAGPHTDISHNGLSHDGHSS
ncbi:hypothetical protein MRX96_021577 [Rhipicephalus microplus]